MRPRDEDHGPSSRGDAPAQQFSAFVLSAFGVLALAVATVDLFRVVSDGVSQRTREMGIRVALRADGVASSGYSSRAALR